MKKYVLPALSILFIVLIFILKPHEKVTEGYTLGSQNKFTPTPTQRPSQRYIEIDNSPQLEPFSSQSGFLAPKDLQ